MCVPVAAALAVASTAVSAAGQIQQGMQARAQANYEAQVAQQNRALSVDAAHQSVLAGQDERLDFWRKVSAIKGQQVAAMAANGIDLGFGAGQRTQDDTQMQANEDATRLYQQIGERTKGHLIDASNYVSEAKAATARGKAAMTNALFGAAGTVLSGASQVAGMKAKMGKTGG